jgi:transaldolase
VLERKLSPNVTKTTDTSQETDEKRFRWQLNEDAMATEKLAEGIRSFALNQIQLEELIQQMVS